MASYDELFEQATILRVKHHNAVEAIANYRQALLLGGPRDREILHMIGVCCQMAHCYEVALVWYRRALAIPGAAALERGNIERDKAESFSALGRNREADAAIAASLRLLPYRTYPAEHAATLGFQARHLRRQGRLGEAIQVFAYADRLLTLAGIREPELYNKLAYASALAEGGRHFQARRVAIEALALSRRYGAPIHRQRALIILAAGYRGDQLFGRLISRPSNVNCADLI